MHVISVRCLLDAFNCMKAGRGLVQRSLYRKPYSCFSCHMQIWWTGSLQGGLGVEFTHSPPGPTNTLSLPTTSEHEFRIQQKRSREIGEG